MKRWHYLFVGVLILIGVYGSQSRIQSKNELKVTSSQTHHQAKPSERVISFVPLQFPSHRTLVKPKRSPANFVKRKQPQPIPGIALGKNPIQIGKSFKVVEGVATLEKVKYKKSMGKKIFENDQYVFFKSASSKTEAWPVALNSTNLKLYPISHILNVKGVDANTREQFKAEGMQEYYYQPRMQLIFLEATPATVLKQYQTLTARGFDVRLEVIKETPKAN